jgi:hypothetical protein
MSLSVRDKNTCPKSPNGNHYWKIPGTTKKFVKAKCRYCKKIREQINSYYVYEEGEWNTGVGSADHTERPSREDRLARDLAEEARKMFGGGW